MVEDHTTHVIYRELKEDLQSELKRELYLDRKTRRNLWGIIVVLVPFLGFGTWQGIQSVIDNEISNLTSTKMYQQAKTDRTKINDIYIESSNLLEGLSDDYSQIENSLFRKLKSDPDFIKLTKGRKGEKGDKGDNGDKGNPGTDAKLPANIVVAFASRAQVDETRNPCPQGWSELIEARGRFIIGAGTYQTDGSDKTSIYQPFNSRGKKEVILEESQMPVHSHTSIVGIHSSNKHKAFFDLGELVTDEEGKQIDFLTGYSWGPVKPSLTSKYGKEKPEPIQQLPPYIPLYICKKELSQNTSG